MAVAEMAKFMTSTFWAGRGAVKASSESDPTVQTCRIAAAAGSAYGALHTANAISSKLDNGLFADSKAVVDALHLDKVSQSATGKALKTAGAFANAHVNKFIFGAMVADIMAAPDEKKAEVASKNLTGFAGMYAVESAMKTKKGVQVIEKIVEKIPGSGKFGAVKAVATTALIVGGSLLGTAAGRKIGDEAYSALFSNENAKAENKPKA